METIKTIPTILITGATGNIGTELAKALSARGIPFRALVRSADKADELAALPGVTLVEGDFDDAASLAPALAGVDRAFLLTPSSEKAEQQQLIFVREAQKAGVMHLVKLSQLAADAHSPVRFLRYHAVVEQAIRESGLAYTFLRPNLFMQGLLNFRESILHEGKFYAAIGDAKISMVDVRDIAAVAVATLTGVGHETKTYILTGPAAITHAEAATYLTAALDRTVQFVDIPPQAMRDALTQINFPAWQADGIIEDYAHYSRGEAAFVTDDIEQTAGTSPLDFQQFARDYKVAF